jgi:hypothetical protein
MGNTANNNWPYPESTDLVKDGATAIENLADAIDTTLGVYSPATPMGVHLSTVSFNGVASQSLNNVFSATYRNYRILVDFIPATTSGVVSLRMRASGADNSTSNYQRINIFPGASSPSQTRTNNATEWVLLGLTTNESYSIAFDLFKPFETLSTHGSLLAEFRATSTTANEVIMFQLGFNGTTSFDGISLLSSGSNLTGSISIFGYNK